MSMGASPWNELQLTTDASMWWTVGVHQPEPNSERARVEVVVTSRGSDVWVVVNVRIGQRLKRLEHAAHLRLLAILAEAWVVDSEEGKPAANRGWVYVEDAMGQLGLEPGEQQRFYVYTQRVRDSLADAGVRVPRFQLVAARGRNFTRELRLDRVNISFRDAS